MVYPYTSIPKTKRQTVKIIVNEIPNQSRATANNHRNFVAVPQPPANIYANDTTAVDSAASLQNYVLEQQAIQDSIVLSEQQVVEFQGTTISPSNLEAKPRIEVQYDWIALVLIAIMAGIAWVRVAHPRKLKQTFSTFIYTRFVKQVMREELVFSHGASLTLVAGFILTAGLFLTQLHTTSFLGFSLFPDVGIILYVKFCLVLVALYTVKLIIIKFLQFVLDTDSGLSEYVFSTFLINKVLGVALIPCVVAVTYLPVDFNWVFFYVGLGLIGVTYLYRISRGIIIGFSENVSSFYLILYLCTLEILPLVAIILLFSL